MIEINELRLGNWILSPEGKPFKVYQETFCDIDNVEFFPIPLTPEILEKCGFEAVPNKEGIYRKGQLQLYRVGEGGTMCYTQYNANEYCYLGTVIHHLHQLQNLYFAMTGTELKINL